MGMGVHDMQHTMARPRQSQTLGTDITSLFVISLTSDNRQTKGWLLYRRVWQQTLSVWQQTSSRSGNRQKKGGSVIGLFLTTDSKTGGLATVKQTVWQQTKPLSHWFQLSDNDVLFCLLNIWTAMTETWLHYLSILDGLRKRWQII